MNQMNEWASAEFGGPSIDALPAFKGDKLRPHKGGSSGTHCLTAPDSIKQSETFRLDTVQSVLVLYLG